MEDQWRLHKWSLEEINNNSSRGSYWADLRWFHKQDKEISFIAIVKKIILLLHFLQ